MKPPTKEWKGKGKNSLLIEKAIEIGDFLTPEQARRVTAAFARNPARARRLMQARMGGTKAGTAEEMARWALEVTDEIERT